MASAHAIPCLQENAYPAWLDDVGGQPGPNGGAPAASFLQGPDLFAGTLTAKRGWGTRRRITEAESYRLKYLKALMVQVPGAPVL